MRIYRDILLAAALCAGTNLALAATVNVGNSADFANAFNTEPAGTVINVMNDITLSNTLNTNSNGLTIQGNSGTETLNLGSNVIKFDASNFNSFTALNASILNITIANATGASAVEFDGDGYASHAYSVGNSTFNTNTGAATGGALYMLAQAQGSGQTYSWSVSDSTFTGNSAQNGGAVYNMSDNSQSGMNVGFSITDSNFSDNTATSGSGGAVYNYLNGGAANNTFGISGGTFSDNTAASGQGGAIYNFSSNPYGGSGAFSATNATFTGNSAANGGAIYNDGEGGTGALSFVMDGSTFTENTATNQGGAVVLALGITGNAPYGGTALFSLQNTTFDNNSATLGGAIYKYTNVGGTQLGTQISGTFTENSATDGGAIWNSTSNYSGTGIASIVTVGDGTTFENNTATGQGGAIYNTNQGYINLNSGATGINFSGNSAANNQSGQDIYFANTKATVNFNVNGAGNINIQDGIAGIGGTIAMTGVAPNTGGVLNLNGSNEFYLGNFTQNSGQTEVGGSFFGGTSAMNNGLLEFNDNSTFAKTGTLTLNGGQTNITNTTNNMTLGDGSSSGTQLKGTGSLNKSGSQGLVLVGDESGYTGTFTQTAGYTSAQNGIMFGGHNIIQNSQLYVTGSSLYYNADLYSGAMLNHLSNSTSVTTITPATAPAGKGVYLEAGASNVLMSFGSGLAGSVITPVQYNLASKLDNGLDNTVTFNYATVILGSSATTTGQYYTSTQYAVGSTIYDGVVNPSIDYGGDTGGTTYQLNNTTLDLANSSSNYQNYYFSKMASSASVSDYITFKAGNLGSTPISGSNPLVADTLTVADAGTSQIGVSRIYIYDTNAPLSGRVRILYGDPITFDTDIPISQYSATTNSQYNITATDANGNTAGTPGAGDIQWIEFTAANAPLTPGPTSTILDSVNMRYSSDPTQVSYTDSVTSDIQANRTFQIDTNQTYLVSDGATGDYQNLHEMDSGTFAVYGQSPNSADISTQILDGNGRSLFNMTGANQSGDTGTTSFTLSDLTVTGANADSTSAGSSGNGSVLSLTDQNADPTNSTAMLSNLNITNNSATGDGGAIYQTGGSLSITNANFDSNTAAGKGGAIDYEGGLITLAGANFNNNSATDGGAIYNAGNLTVSSGTFTNNTASDNGGAIYNAGTLNLTSTNSSDIGFLGNTAGNLGNDIYNNNGTINVDGDVGTVYIGDGISGTGTIDKSGGGTLTLAAGSDSTGYTGTFTQTAGTTNMIGSSFGGDMQINGGTLNWGNTTPHTTGRSLEVNDGATLNILNGGYLQMNNPIDVISPDATLNINQGGTLEIQNANDVTINSSDTWAGSVIMDGTGMLTLDGVDSSNVTGTYKQTSGNLNITNGSDISLGKGTQILGGNITVSNSNLSLNGANLNLGAGTSGSEGNLTLNNAFINASTGVISTNNFAGSLNGTGTNNFAVDVNGATQTSDTFNFGGTISGNINVSNFNFTTAPTVQDFEVHVFTANDYDSSVFTTTSAPVRTALGIYSVESLGDGWYGFDLTGFNNQASRGQVATLAMLNSNLTTITNLFDHVYLDSNENLALNKMQNRYAAGTMMYAPYQFAQDEGGLWFKNYVNFETLSMTQGLNVQNNNWGSIVGADFHPVELGKGWKMMPTAFINYAGGNQNYSGVSMYQNGGQGGVMSTFSKGNFIGSILGFAGGYSNEMTLEGTTDNTGNWFAGAATKAAYNYRPSRHWILQPWALVAYNVFGSQHWGSDFGAISMNAGMLNGINVAPGLNFIYGRETWSAYLTTMYMYNINDKINGSAGGINLPDLQMRHGYVEYGVGGTKTFKERFMGWAQVTLRNGGRTGVGLAFGLSYRF